MEPFASGETVTLTGTRGTLGRIVAVSDDGSVVDVRWLRHPQHEHEVTRESAEAVRRVHESDEGML